MQSVESPLLIGTTAKSRTYPEQILHNPALFGSEEEPGMAQPVVKSTVKIRRTASFPIFSSSVMSTSSSRTGLPLYRSNL